MNKKILISLSVIGVVAAIAVGGTIAYFSDTETSVGNTFSAGSIDLTVDNTCYYNGQACTSGYWGGVAANGACACTWALDNLTGKVFFNFADLKPGDFEEDTISLHVDNNPAWACAKITMTANDDMTCTEPELADDPNCANPGAGLGDLAQALNFVWWADDGDNVLETDEYNVSGAFVTGTFDWMMNDDTPYFGSNPNEMLLTLSDSDRNFFNPGQIAPLSGATTYYIGKAFCFGTLGFAPVAEGAGVSPLTASGITCNGVAVNNASQSDKLTADLEFTVVQARNNANFVCPENQTSQPEIIAVQSSVFNFSGTGWAGWSCPVGHPNIISADTTNCSQPLTVSQMAKLGVAPYPDYPHYDYTSPNEEGWVIQNGGTPQSCYIVLQCQAN